ncbi:MAG TPA: WG repeat-containing protein [Flavobacteriales bacterium]|nr:WG repeat-containing protein [Flavobacteriales bacterium]
MEIRRRIAFLALFLAAGILHGQDNSYCYTKRELSLFNMINAERKKAALPELSYSHNLTIGAVKQVDRAINNPDSEYKQLRDLVPEYSSFAMPFSFSVASRYAKLSGIVNDIFTIEGAKEYILDQTEFKMTAMGVCIEGTRIYVYVGTKTDESGTMSLCNEPDASQMPYAWLREPDLHDVKIYEAEGTVACREGTGWGFMDTTGQMLIPCNYSGVTWFAKGLACVINQDYKAALINKNHEIVIPFGKYKMIQVDVDAVCSRLVVEDEAFNQYLADMDGNIISKAYEEINFSALDQYSFYEKGKKGVMDANAKVLLPAKYGEISGYSEGFYGFQSGGKWGFLDRNFNIVIPAKYGSDVYYGFHEGLSHFEVNHKVGFMDTTGKIIIPAIFDEAGLFNKQGHTIASKNGKFGIIDRTGKFVVPAEYETIERDARDGYWVAKKDGLFGVLDNANQWRLKPLFEGMYWLAGNRYLVQLDGYWGMIKVNFQ